MQITYLIFTLYIFRLKRNNNLMYPIVPATLVHAGGGERERARQKTELQISIGVKEKII